MRSGSRTPSRPLACPGLIALALTVVGLSLFAGDAGAANTRVSITNFKWSSNPSIGLGEKVIWDWLGPDTGHSVTGLGPGGIPVDSDAGVSPPRHRPGDTFELAFDQPGIYSFACKIHPSVRGTVDVSAEPGDPDSDPGPQPTLFWDADAPLIDEVQVLNPRIRTGERGGGLRFAINEKALADVEYWRLVRNGRSTDRVYEGYSEWRTHIGYNQVRFGGRSARFPASPGRYVGLLRARDDFFNLNDPTVFRFEIRP